MIETTLKNVYDGMGSALEGPFDLNLKQTLFNNKIIQIIFDIDFQLKNGSVTAGKKKIDGRVKTKDTFVAMVGSKQRSSIQLDAIMNQNLYRNDETRQSAALEGTIKYLDHQVKKSEAKIMGSSPFLNGTLNVEASISNEGNKIILKTNQTVLENKENNRIVVIDGVLTTTNLTDLSSEVGILAKSNFLLGKVKLDVKQFLSTKGNYNNKINFTSTQVLLKGPNDEYSVEVDLNLNLNDFVSTKQKAVLTATTNLFNGHGELIVTQNNRTNIITLTRDQNIYDNKEYGLKLSSSGELKIENFQKITSEASLTGKWSANKANTLTVELKNSVKETSVTTLDVCNHHVFVISNNTKIESKVSTTFTDLSDVKIKIDLSSSTNFYVNYFRQLYIDYPNEMTFRKKHKFWNNDFGVLSFNYVLDNEHFPKINSKFNTSLEINVNYLASMIQEFINTLPS